MEPHQNSKISPVLPYLDLCDLIPQGFVPQCEDLHRVIYALVKTMLSCNNLNSRHRQLWRWEYRLRRMVRMEIKQKAVWTLIVSIWLSTHIWMFSNALHLDIRGTAYSCAELVCTVPLWSPTFSDLRVLILFARGLHSSMAAPYTFGYTHRHACKYVYLRIYYSGLSTGTEHIEWIYTEFIAMTYRRI